MLPLEDVNGSLGLLVGSQEKIVLVKQAWAHPALWLPILARDDSLLHVSPYWGCPLLWLIVKKDPELRVHKL